MRQCLQQVLVYVVLGPCSKSEQHMHGIILLAKSRTQLHGVWRDTADIYRHVKCSNITQRVMPDLLPSPDAVQWSRNTAVNATLCRNYACASSVPTIHQAASQYVHEGSAYFAVETGIERDNRVFVKSARVLHAKVEHFINPGYRPRRRLERQIEKKREALRKLELNAKVKEDLKTVALGTSKINYLDPRITVAWCKLHEVPIEKIFNKSLLSKFHWSMDIEPEWRF